MIESSQNERKIRSTSDILSKSFRRTQFFEQDKIENDYYSDSENEDEKEQEQKKKNGLWNKFYKFMKKANEIVREDLQEEQET